MFCWASFSLRIYWFVKLKWVYSGCSNCQIHKVEKITKIWPETSLFFPSGKVHAKLFKLHSQKWTLKCLCSWKFLLSSVRPSLPKSIQVSNFGRRNSVCVQKCTLKNTANPGVWFFYPYFSFSVGKTYCRENLWCSVLVWKNNCLPNHAYWRTFFWFGFFFLPPWLNCCHLESWSLFQSWPGFSESISTFVCRSITLLM